MCVCMCIWPDNVFEVDFTTVANGSCGFDVWRQTVNRPESIENIRLSTRDQLQAKMREHGIPGLVSCRLHAIMSDMDFVQMHAPYPDARSDADPNMSDMLYSDDEDPNMPALMSDSDSSDSDDNFDDNCEAKFSLI
jgi:hypothetical protein